MNLAIHTLGCKLNFAESSDLVRQFAAQGFGVVPFDEKADVYIINTCTVTATAEKKCRTAIRQAIATNSDAIVAVIGCFAQNNPQSVASIPGVDLVLGNEEKLHLVDFVQQRLQQRQDKAPIIATSEPRDFQPAYSGNDRTRTFFKIQDGCDYFCTYCAIPFARGRSRSATIESTIAKAREIAETGTKEVVLTGVNTGTFGLHQDEKFIDLLRQLDDIEGISRYRISSIEPNLITDDIVDFVAHSKHFAHHFHIPLQSGSDTVLKLMCRRYDTTFYASKLQLIKERMPEACIATDLMVGFYGETEEEFERTCQFVESIPLSYLHVFPYSERPNTAALKMDGKVPVHERHLRSEAMHEISERKKRQFYTENTGTEQQVLWESDVKQGKMYGFTDNYIRVRTKLQPQLINQLQTITLNTLNEKEDFFEN